MLLAGGRVGSRGEALSRCWANGRLRRALTAYLLFNINEWASWIALMVWAYDGHGVRGASVIAMSQVVPAALLASAAAARLGRMRAPQALRLGYGVQAVTAAVVGAAVIADASFGLVCVLAAVASVGITLTRPVHNALLPEISDTTSELTAANAGSGWVESVAIFVGPLISGILTAWWHPGGVLLVMAGASGVALWCAVGLGPGVPHQLTGDDERAASSWRVVVRDPAARLLSALVAAEYVLIGILDILLVVLALDQLGMSDAGPGVLNSALGIGGMIGAALTVVLIGAKRIAPALVVGAVTAGGAAALAGLSPGPLVAIALLAVCGAGKVFFDVALRTFVQRLLPDHLLTAVFGLQESMMMAGLAVGALIGTPAGDGDEPGRGLRGRRCVPAGGGDRGLVEAGPSRRVHRGPGGPAGLARAGADAEHAGAPGGRAAGRLLGSRAASRRRGRRDRGRDRATSSTSSCPARSSSPTAPTRSGRLGPGDWFGELALLHADARRTASVTTLSPVSLLTVDRRTFLTALAGTPRAITAADDYARDHYR